ncbi:tripartite tricarboxylate transporter substrate binding protein [Roseomonas sp. NAR14]|uniref:Tripartite tricarboxylate transporter substrate binding protein n=1 Tax=Roseomonas acroporae TaxID=2937791 RepID=A0A9X1Y838_9PROT|nr:tripartite tricarboxylate transporter substrate binding protein [Roseomonas acroporae]MCK8785283.1 tripartite tricarboxylate transporter substrate binding protein [Roseomonas acroporae]
MDQARIRRRDLLATLAATPLAAPLVAPLVAPGRALAAEGFPSRPVKWIVAYAAGGGTDTLARLLGANLSQRLGQPFVIDNRPGAATNVGAEAAAKAAPDGYTVFSADNGTLVFNTALFRRLPYDPERDFRGVGLMARFPLFLAVAPDYPARTLRELLDRAKAAPGTIDVASPGVGSPHHLALERFAREAGVRFNHVPYRGAAPALNDLLAGTVPAMVVDYPSSVDYLRSGRVRPLAVFSAARPADLPDVPTAQEAAGLRGFEAYAWQGMVVPKATPDAVVARLTEELARTLADEGVRRRMREIGLEPLTGGPAEFQALLNAERATWLPLIRELGITLD